MRQENKKKFIGEHIQHIYRTKNNETSTENETWFKKYPGDSTPDKKEILHILIGNMY